jgi:hypothetical protein
MSNTPAPSITEEKAAAAIAANRFMHLLQHPEEQNRDGEHVDQTRSRAMNELRILSLHLPPKTSNASQQAITTKLQRSDRPR